MSFSKIASALESIGWGLIGSTYFCQSVAIEKLEYGSLPHFIIQRSQLDTQKKVFKQEHDAIQQEVKDFESLLREDGLITMSDSLWSGQLTDRGTALRKNLEKEYIFESAISLQQRIEDQLDTLKEIKRKITQEQIAPVERDKEVTSPYDALYAIMLQEWQIDGLWKAYHADKESFQQSVDAHEKDLENSLRIFKNLYEPEQFEQELLDVIFLEQKIGLEEIVLQQTFLESAAFYEAQYGVKEKEQAQDKPLTEEETQVIVDNEFQQTYNNTLEWAGAILQGVTQQDYTERLENPEKYGASKPTLNIANPQNGKYIKIQRNLSEEEALKIVYWFSHYTLKGFSAREFRGTLVSQ